MNFFYFYSTYGYIKCNMNFACGDNISKNRHASTNLATLLRKL